MNKTQTVSFAMLGTALMTAAFYALAADPSPYAKCASIKDATKRVACYDSVEKSSAKKNAISEADRAAGEKEAPINSSVNFEEYAVPGKNAAAEKGAETKAASDNEKMEREKAVIAAKDALKALKKLQIRVETGVSYRDFPSIFSDAKFEVTQFTESAHAKRLPEFARAVSMAIFHYERAYALWSNKFNGGGGVIYSYQETMVRNGLSLGHVRSDSPASRKYIEALSNDYGVPAEKERDSDGKEWGYLVVDHALPFIWAQAAKETAKASSLLPQ